MSFAEDGMPRIIWQGRNALKEGKRISICIRAVGPHQVGPASPVNPANVDGGLRRIAAIMFVTAGARSKRRNTAATSETIGAPANGR